jgi:hypothetical protein
MTSLDFKVGDEVFIPFWVVLRSLDATPPTPFIRCKIVKIASCYYNSPQGPQELIGCDLNLGKDGLIAPNIPLSYLIRRSDLADWATKLADWFLSYPPLQS